MGGWGKCMATCMFPKHSFVAKNALDMCCFDPMHSLQVKNALETVYIQCILLKKRMHWICN